VWVEDAALCARVSESGRRAWSPRRFFFLSLSANEECLCRAPPRPSPSPSPKRLSSQARQELHLDLDPAFQPTGNARCVAMMAEAAAFAGQLKKCERDIRGVKAAAEGET